MNLLLQLPDAARTLGIGRSKLYELIAEKKITVVKIGRRTLIAQGELERYVRELCGADDVPEPMREVQPSEAR